MGCHGIEQGQQCTILSPGHCPLLIHIVDQRHHSRDGGIVLQTLIVAADFFYGLVHLGFQIGAVALSFHHYVLQLPDSLQESAASLHTVLTPCGGHIKSTDKHLISTQSIRAVLLHDLVRIDHITQRFAHLHDGMFRHLAEFLHQSCAGCLLTAILLHQTLLLLLSLVYKAVGIQSKDHAVAGPLLIWFRTEHHTLIVQEFVPETGVQQMQRGMLHTAVVPIHRHPVLKRLLAGKGLFVMRIYIPQEIPRRTCPLGHGIRLSLSRSATAGTCGIDPFGHSCQRRLSVIGRLIGFHFRQGQRQFALIDGHIAALITFYDGNGFAPITLSGEHPVTQLEISLAGTDALLLQKRDDPVLGIRHGQTVQKLRVHQRTGSNIRKHLLLHRNRAPCHHLNDGQAELLRELPVSLIVGGHSHNSAGAIGH